MQAVVRIVAVLLLSLPALAVQREVGSGQTYSTIGTCITAASAGDVCNVHTGTYSASITISKAVTVQNNSGDSPAIVGLVDITSDNATFTGFDVSGVCSTYYVHGDGRTGLTIANNTVHGCTNGTGIYLRNSTNSTISGNESYANAVGLETISAHSTDATYTHGVQVLNNNSHDNNTDGMEMHAQYLTIAGNTISDNIDVNWASHHPDGIQLLAGTADGFTSVQHALIYNNTIRNQTQNIFSEGTSSGQSSDTQDIWIFNNVLYNTLGTVNGVDMLALGGVNAMLKWSRDVYFLNNSLGDIGTSGNSIHVQDCYNASVHIKNNNIINSVSNGVYVEDPSDIAAGELDYNSYFIGGTPVIWNTTFYATLAAFKAAVPTQESHGLSGNPLANSFPVPTLQTGSPLNDAAIDLTSLGVAQLDNDKAGTARGPWDIGAYQLVSTPGISTTISGKSTVTGKSSIR